MNVIASEMVDFKHTRVNTNDARIAIVIVPGWLVGRGPWCALSWVKRQERL